MTTKRRAMLCIVANMLCGHVAFGQDASNQKSDLMRDGIRIDQFLDGMYIGPRIARKAERNGFDPFEAQIAPHLFFFNRVESVLTPHKGFWSWGGWAASFVPLLRMRMTNDTSAPVRTPSYNPQFITVQKFFTWGFDATTHDWPIETGWASLVAVQYTIAHHSNGQDGCTFLGTGERDGTCKAAAFSDNKTPKVNTANGNYGTNYETIGAFLKRFRLDSNHTERMAWRVGATLERYQWTLVSEHLPGGLSDDTASMDLQRIFGKHRLTLDFEYEQKVDRLGFGRLRTRAAFTQISAASNIGMRYRISVDATVQRKGGSGIGAFGKLFYGQDYYNIRLQDVGLMEVVGLSWDVRPLQVFRAKPDPPKSGTEPQPMKKGGTQ